MPMLPVIANVWRCAFVGDSGTGLNFVNVMHFLDDLGTQVYTDFFTAIEANVQANQYVLLSENYRVKELHLTKLDGVSSTRVHTTSSARWTGTETGNVMPAVAAVVHEQTALRGAAHRGRIFLGPWPEVSGASGEIAAGSGFTDMAGAWNDFLTDMQGAAWPPVVASYKLGSAQVIESLTLERLLATQRRRQSRLRA
jgi:hypothetical protein